MNTLAEQNKVSRTWMHVLPITAYLVWVVSNYRCFIRKLYSQSDGFWPSLSFQPLTGGVASGFLQSL